jgi:hypothetical protein
MSNSAYRIDPTVKLSVRVREPRRELLKPAGRRRRLATVVANQPGRSSNRAPIQGPYAEK